MKAPEPELMCGASDLHGDDAPWLVAVGLAGVVLVEGVQDGVELVAEGAAADGVEVEAQVVQQELHPHLGVACMGLHPWRPAQDQGGGVHLAALHELRNKHRSD